MGDLGATLIKELNCETAFTIGGIGISESVVVTWIMMAVVLVVSLIVTHGLKVEHPGRGQLLLENAVTWLQGIGEGILGEEGKGYAPYLTSVLMYLGVANLLGILGFKPPTKDLNVTAALALMSIVLIETAGIRVKGLKGWLKSFTEPIAIVTPINIMEVFIKPLSLCMRLFGNVLGAFVIMELLMLLTSSMVISQSANSAMTGFHFLINALGFTDLSFKYAVSVAPEPPDMLSPEEP